MSDISKTKLPSINFLQDISDPIPTLSSLPKPQLPSVKLPQGISNPIPNISSLPKPNPLPQLRKINIDEIEPAPKEWNFFNDQPQEKVADLAISLLNEGQISPIFVRERHYPDKPGKKYECLTGHTRIRAAKILVNEGRTEWKQLNAQVYLANSCDDTKAQQLIVYSNTTQRTSFTSDEKRSCFIFEYLNEANSGRRQKASDIIENLQKKFKLKRTYAYNLRSIATNLLSDFSKMLEAGKITTTQATALSSLDQETQQYLADNYKDAFKKININSCKNKTTDQIDQMFKKEVIQLSSLIYTYEVKEDVTSFSVRVPDENIPAFRTAMKKFYTSIGYPVEDTPTAEDANVELKS